MGEGAWFQLVSVFIIFVLLIMTVYAWIYEAYRKPWEDKLAEKYLSKYIDKHK